MREGNCSRTGPSGVLVYNAMPSAMSPRMPRGGTMRTPSGMRTSTGVSARISLSTLSVMVLVAAVHVEFPKTPSGREATEKEERLAEKRGMTSISSVSAPTTIEGVNCSVISVGRPTTVLPAGSPVGVCQDECTGREPAGWRDCTWWR